MNSYKNISIDLKAFFNGNKILRMLLSLDMILVFGGVGLIVLNSFVTIGGLLYAIAYYAFFLGLILTYANFNENFLLLGLVIYGGIEGIDFLRYALFRSYKFIDYFSLVTCIIFLFLGYKVFKVSGIRKK